MILRLEKHAEVLTSYPNVSVLGSDMQLGFHQGFLSFLGFLCVSDIPRVSSPREKDLGSDVGTNFDEADMAGKLNDEEALGFFLSSNFELHNLFGLWRALLGEPLLVHPFHQTLFRPPCQLRRT